MQINLKQHEIEAALKGYINAQGISLMNKDVAISFTAGRKESGLSAEVIIEDSVNKIVPTILNRSPLSPVVETPVPNEVQTEVVEEVVAEDPPVEEAPAKTVSLFG
jgi:hypothetical protein